MNHIAKCPSLSLSTWYHQPQGLWVLSAKSIKIWTLWGIMTLSLNSAKCLLNLCKLFNISSLLVAKAPPKKGEFNFGIVGKLFFLLILGFLGPSVGPKAAAWASVDNGRETATQLKPLRNLSSPSFLSPVGTTEIYKWLLCFFIRNQGSCTHLKTYVPTRSLNTLRRSFFPLH